VADFRHLLTDKKKKSLKNQAFKSTNLSYFNVLACYSTPFEAVPGMLLV
jgi:hypothetical protein